MTGAFQRHESYAHAGALQGRFGIDRPLVGDERVGGAAEGQTGRVATVDPSATDPGAAVGEIVPGGADAVVETSGSASAHARLQDYLRGCWTRT